MIIKRINEWIWKDEENVFFVIFILTLFLMAFVIAAAIWDCLK
jgi:hypothetical protein